MRKTKKFFIVLAAIFVSTVSLTSCDNHKHDYSSLWSYDSDSHWHDAMCEHNAQKDKKSHEWTEVSTTSGTKTVCSVCGKEKKENATYEVDKETFKNAISNIDNYTYTSFGKADDETESTTIYSVSNDKLKYESDEKTQIITKDDSNYLYLLYTLADDKTNWTVSLETYNSISYNIEYTFSSTLDDYSDFTYNTDEHSYTYEYTDTYADINMYGYWAFYFEDGKLINALVKVNDSEHTALAIHQLTNVGSTEDFDVPNVKCYEMNYYTFNNAFYNLDNFTISNYGTTAYVTSNSIKYDYSDSDSQIYTKNGDKYYTYVISGSSTQKYEISEDDYTYARKRTASIISCYDFTYDEATHKYTSSQYKLSLYFENGKLIEITPLEGSIISNIGTTTVDIPNA